MYIYTAESCLVLCHQHHLLPTMPFDTLTNSSDVSPDYLPSLPLIPALDNTFGAYLIGTTVGLAYVLHSGIGNRAVRNKASLLADYTVFYCTR